MSLLMMKMMIAMPCLSRAERYNRMRISLQLFSCVTMRVDIKLLFLLYHSLLKPCSP